MPKLHVTTKVQATPEAIFGFLADYRNIPVLQPHFESARLLGDTTHGKGAVIELKGHFHGFPITATDRIISFTPPYRLVSISEGMVLSRTTWELRPISDGPDPLTEASFTLEYKVGGPLGNLFTGLASSLFNKEVETMTQESMRRLSTIFAANKDT